MVSSWTRSPYLAAPCRPSGDCTILSEVWSDADERHLCDGAA